MESAVSMLGTPSELGAVTTKECWPRRSIQDLGCHAS